MQLLTPKSEEVQLLAPKFLGSKSSFSLLRRGTIFILQTTTKTVRIFRQSQKGQYQLITRVYRRTKLLLLLRILLPLSFLKHSGPGSKWQCFTSTHYYLSLLCTANPDNGCDLNCTSSIRLISRTVFWIVRDYMVITLFHFLHRQVQGISASLVKN